MPRVAAAGVQLRTSVFVEHIADATVASRSTLDGSVETLNADTVVLSVMREGDDNLYRQLKAAGRPVRRVGGCVAPHEIDDAILEGFREGSAIA